MSATNRVAPFELWPDGPAEEARESAAGPQLIAPIRDKIAQRTKILLGREVPIVFQKTVGYGGVAGAAGLVFLKHGLLAI